MKPGTLVRLVALECLLAIWANWKRPPRPGKHRTRIANIPVTQKQLDLWGYRDRFDPRSNRKRASARSSLARFLRKITTALVDDANRMGWPHRFVQLPAFPELGSSVYVAIDATDPVSVRARVFYDGMADQMKVAVDWMGDSPGSQA